MSNVLAFVAGYLIGSLPTANAIARARGIDLRTGGSRNPGTNNARNLGGLGLAAPVLLAELIKGVASVYLGQRLAGDPGAAIGGVAAIAGNVVNLWYRFSGGKGLAIAGGVLVALWPPGFLVLVATIVLGAIITKSTGMASLVAIGTMLTMGLIWAFVDGPNWWGIEDLDLLPYFTLAAALLLTPKHLSDARGRFRPTSPP